MTITPWTMIQIADQLAKQETTATALAQAYLTHIDQMNPSLNALIHLDHDKTMAQAAQADILRAQGDTRRFLGVPLVHKDLFCQRTWPATCASKMLANFVSPYDAHVVEQCDAAGFITLGRANMDEFAMGSSNENSYFGPVHNPWDLKASPGGSSGGSAAAVAARLTPVATASDTGGSIRQPASHCGITGIKPTYGIVSRFGMIAYASSLDQGGVMAQTAEDCAHMLNVIAGFDERDSTSLNRPKEDYTQSLAAPLTGLRIGLPKEYFGQGLSSDVAMVVADTVKVLTQLGAQCLDISLPNTAYAPPAYYIIAPTEASANLSRYDGVRYGHRAASYRDLDDLYAQSRSEGFGLEVKRRIMVGNYVLSHGYYEAYYKKAQKVRRLLSDDFKRAYEQCDVILGPVAPTAAGDLGVKNTDPSAVYLSDIYTLAPNLAGLPALSMPAGFAANLRPIGVQLIGNYFTEALLLQIAHQFQQVTAFHQNQPKNYKP
jgi:aspartyl-tRNA(Asn)/glutamyl-tRNA(Gln) amidotransferase subunit A